MNDLGKRLVSVALICTGSVALGDFSQEVFEKSAAYFVQATPVLASSITTKKITLQGRCVLDRMYGGGPEYFLLDAPQSDSASLQQITYSDPDLDVHETFVQFRSAPMGTVHMQEGDNGALVFLSETYAYTTQIEVRQFTGPTGLRWIIKQFIDGNGENGRFSLPTKRDYYCIY